MAEPNSLPPEDRPAIQPDIPELRAQENMTGHRPEPSSGGFYNPRGDSMASGTPAKSSSPSDLAAAESAGTPSGASHEQAGTGYYNPIEKLSPSAKVKTLLGIKRRKALIGGGIGGGIIGLIIAGFFFLIPLKIESIVQNLENRFFSTSKNDVESEADNAFKKFMKKEVGGALANGQCKNDISRDCNIRIGSSKNPITNMYKAWADNKIEKTLADQYGIELRFDRRSHNFYLKAPGINGEAKVGEGGVINDSEFKIADRGTVRQAFRDAEEGMTHWDKIMFRYKVGRLLEEKYGIKRCIIFCGVKDPLSDKKDSVLGGLSQKQAAAQIYLVQRVIMPLDAARGIAIACIIDPSCDPVSAKPSPSDGTNGETHNEPESQTDTKLRQTFVSLAGNYGGSVDDALKEYGNMKEKGYSTYAVNSMLKQLGYEELSTEGAKNFSNLSNWFGLAQRIVGYLQDSQKIGPKVKKLSYAINAAAAVSLYMEYRTYADEIHTGHVDATEVGSMVDSLGPGDHGNGSTNDPEVGGSADATGTPLYQNLMDGTNTTSSTSTTTSLLDNFLPSTAYAASKTSTASSNYGTYKCKDGSIPTGSLVCPEEKLGGGNDTLNAISKFTGSGVAGTVINIAGVINEPIFKLPSTLLGDAVGALMGLLSNIPGISSIIHSASDLVNSALAPLFKSVISDVIPSPFGSNMSGGRTFDMMAAGADVSGNDYAHTGLGGRKLSPAEVASITNDQQNQSQQQFSHETFFARMFDTNSQYSLVSKVAMDMPLSLQSSAESSFASLLSNPFGTLTHGFASLFSGRVSAATPAQPDPFNVVQYGYTDSEIPSDPEAYWDQNCSDGVDGQMTQQWNNAAANNLDPNTEMPVNDGTDPCLLIEATAGSAGGAFDTSLLTQDEQADLSGSSSGSTGSSTSSGNCAGSGKYSALVGSGSSFAGVDQGIDFVPSGSSGFDICAPASGTITLADQTGHTFGRTTGHAEIIEKLDQSPNAPSSSQYIYYAEIIQINSNIQVGTHVNAGDLIGHNAQSPGIEVGWGLNPTEGFMCPIAYPSACGTSFDNWVQGISAGKGP